jgi:hypothetical protein
MKILTSNPVMFGNERLNTPDMYLSVSGVDSNDVKQFQDWLDKRGIKFVGATNAKRDNGKALNKGKGYGNFGPSTTAAYAFYKSMFEGERRFNNLPTSTIASYYSSKVQGSTATQASTTQTQQSTPTTTSQSEPVVEPIPTDISTTESKGFIAKFKAMSTGKKALVIGGSLVAIGLIIYFVKKSRK